MKRIEDMTSDMTQQMKLTDMTIGNVMNGGVKAAARVVLMLLILVAGVGEMWAQTDYSGTYYLRNTQTNNQNYYLVPAVGGYYNNNEATPYLTTFKTAQDMNSMWRLVKVNVDGTDYYRIIHNSTGLYVTANGTVVGQSGNDAARLRIHLEAFNTPTDATLFLITEPSGGKVAIRPKDTSYFVDDKCWWDMGNGNKDNYWNNNWEGALGLWNGLSSPAYNWILESTLPTCAMPVISYNSTDLTFSISYPISEDGASIHYTTDGTEPTADSPVYNDTPLAEGAVGMVRAIAVKEGYVNSAVADFFSPSHAVLFKTTDAPNQSYYMIAPLDDSYLSITTSNVPNARMGWLLELAERSGDIDYYYFKNQATEQYLYCNSGTNNGDALRMKPLNEDGTEPERYKFRLWRTGDYYNIVPQKYAYLPAKDLDNCLRKRDASDNVNPIGLYKDADNPLSRWQFIPVTKCLTHCEQVRLRCSEPSKTVCGSYRQQRRKETMLWVILTPSVRIRKYYVTRIS